MTVSRDASSARPHVPRAAPDARTCSTTRAPPAVPKRKRVVLSLHDKQQVLQRLAHGEPPLALAQAFGISRQQVSDIKKNRDRILAYCSEAKCLLKLKRKTLKAVPPASYPGVEQELYRWLVRQQTLARAVSRDTLWHKTMDLFRHYAADPARLSAAAMTSWLRQFKQAHGLYVLADHELQHLPEQFTPRMHVAKLTPGNGPDAVRPDAVLPMDTHGYRSPHCGSDKRGNSPAQDQIPTRVVSLQTTVDTLGQLNHQLSRFEREMATKLDYLDERVAKLCYFVLPSP